MHRRFDTSCSISSKFHALYDLLESAAPFLSVAPQRFCRGQTALDGFLNGQADLFFGKTRSSNVGEGSRYSCYRQPLSRCYLVGVKAVGVLTDIRPATGGGSWNDDMNLGWHDIRELIQCQGTLLGDNRVRTGTQPGYKQILKFGAGKLGQPVYASPDASESAALHVARESLPGKSALAGLM
jgi:hypothetical protein